MEVRDVAPTLYDVAGILDQVIEIDEGMNGKSLLPILNGSVNKVRDYVDLEHSIVYDSFIHWNALVDESMKYIYNAKDGSETLFNLTSDPSELVDLSSDSDYDEVRLMWRERMVMQFHEEGRGIEWVSDDGNLALRGDDKNTVLGVNFPCL